MGGVKDRYLKRESAGDQYVGRCAAGLDQLSKQFAVSPPYFDFTGIDEELERATQMIELCPGAGRLSTRRPWPQTHPVSLQRVSVNLYTSMR